MALIFCVNLHRDQGSQLAKIYPLSSSQLGAVATLKMDKSQEIEIAAVPN